MPVVVRRIVDDRFKNYTEIAGNSWDLRTQIEALEEWLVVNPNELDPSNQWVADVGFTVRLDATGGGSPITRKRMVGVKGDRRASSFPIVPFGVDETHAKLIPDPIPVPLDCPLRVSTWLPAPNTTPNCLFFLLALRFIHSTIKARLANQKLARHSKVPRHRRRVRRSRLPALARQTDHRLQQARQRANLATTP